MLGSHRSGLVVPVVLWGSKPPKNHITHIISLCKGQLIVTGSKDGQLVQWSVDEGLNWIQPQSMMMAHSAPITCLAPAIKGSSCLRYASCSEDGQICLWDSEGCRVVESACQQYVHRKILPYTIFNSENHAQHKLFCIGDYSEVIVLDAQDLNIVCFLRSRVEPDWLNVMTIVFPNERHVVLGITVSGVIKMWGLQDLDKKDPTSVVYEDEAKALGIKEVRAISCSKVNTRMMLVITVSSWQIIDPSALHQLIVSQTAIEAVTGTIIDIDRIAIGFADSTIVLFQLPRSRLVGKQVRDRFGEKPVPLGNIEHPFVFAILRSLSPPSEKHPSKVNYFFESRVNDRDTKVAYRADEKGRLSVWAIPKNFDSLVEEFIKKRNPTIYEPTIRQSFADVWSRLNPLPPNIFGVEEGRTITASAYVSCQGKLLLGRDDGYIVMTHACNAIGSQLFENTSEEQPRYLQGHTAAVNCFLYPFQDDERYDPDMFISGGKDFAVMVWNLTSGVRMHRFCSQGGPILRMLVPPENCNPRILNCICSVAGDNSVALLSLKESKCILLASRQQTKVVEIKWRPLDDFMLLKCEDNTVYVWQMETGNLDRIVGGILASDVIDACEEQTGVVEIEDKAGASQAVRMFRAFKHKNVDAFKKVVANNGVRSHHNSTSSLLPSPLDVIQLKKCSNDTHLLLFNIDALITGLQETDEKLLKKATTFEHGNELRQSFSTLITRQPENSMQSHLPLQSSSNTLNRHNGSATAQRWQLETNLFMETAKMLLSLLHAWNLKESLDEDCINKLKLQRPKVPLCFGTIGRKGFISLHMPFCTGKNAALNDLSFRSFSKNLRWKDDPQLTTVHLLSLVSVSNALMSLKSSILNNSDSRFSLRRVPSTRSTDTSSSEKEGHFVRQVWSEVASMHCVLLSDYIKPVESYAAPQIDFLARKWHDSCSEIRCASQAILKSELKRMTPKSRKQLIDYWAPYLPTLLDPSISIFGLRDTQNKHSVPSAPPLNSHAPLPEKKAPPPRPAPPIPPRKGVVELPETAKEEPVNNLQDGNTSSLNDHNLMMDGLHQVRRNQATAVVLLGVFGSEFPKDLVDPDLIRAISHSLIELLVLEETPLLPAHSPLRRAAVDLIGRGFAVWQPHVVLSVVLLGLLELTNYGEKEDEIRKGYISPEMDTCLTARHALSLIASSRAQALISTLSTEVARFNAITQHQTVQHNVVSPLMRARTEVLRLIEQLSEKQYNDVAEMIIPVGEILVHCLDVNQIKHSSLAEVFPPIAKFYMIGYCPATRRIAFGGKNGSIVVHDLKSSKAQTIQAHQSPITAVSFSQDGKYLAAYSSQDAKISFWQSQQSFLGMGQSQIRCVKTLPAPPECPVLSPGGTYQTFKARLVWITARSLTLMLPNGKENRFSV